MQLNADCVKNVLKRREGRVTAGRERPVKGFAVDSSGERNLADLVDFGDIAQSEHEYVLRFASRRIKIFRNMHGVF